MIKKQRKIQKDASKAVSNDPNKWTIPVLKANILQKDPTLKTKFFAGLQKNDILLLWVNEYAGMDDMGGTSFSFTKKEQRLLECLEKGEILRYDKTGIFKQAIKGRLEFLVSKVEHIPPEHALALAMKIFQDQFDSSREASIFLTVILMKTILHLWMISQHVMKLIHFLQRMSSTIPRMRN